MMNCDISRGMTFASVCFIVILIIFKKQLFAKLKCTYEGQTGTETGGSAVYQLQSADFIQSRLQ